jgi:hypothetical protein
VSLRTRNDQHRTLDLNRLHRDPIRLRDRERVQLPGDSDSYVGPRSSNVNRTSQSSSRMHDEQLPTAGFANTTRVDASGWGGERLDSPAKIREYIEQRTKDLPPTAESLDLIAREVTERGGTIAIATHMGGTKQSDDAIVLEDGSTIDLIRGVDGPNPEWQWLHHGQSYGATYDPSRNVVDPRTGEMKSFADFITERGKPVPPYIPLIDSGGGGGGGVDHLSGWIVDRDRTKKKEEQDAPAAQNYRPMPGFDPARLNDPNDNSLMAIFGRWIQDNGLPPTLESLQKFVDANPDFEIDGDKIRIKPEALHRYGAGEEAGQWHRAISDDGSGPAWSFAKIDEPQVFSAAMLDPNRQARIRV